MILGGMTVEELGRRMSARELAEWIAYFESIEAIPDPARDAAQIAWIIACANSTKQPKFRDFYPKPPRGDEKGQTEEQMMAMLDRHEE